MPLILEPTDDAIARAATALRAERIVAFPTETVYGLGADLFSKRAISQIYALKGRPCDSPLIILVRDTEEARDQVAMDWDDRCDQLAKRFWPGPLTLILSRRESVPSVAAGGRCTIAMRAPAHAVARQLLAEFGGPIAAPSANRSGHVSPTSALHVADDFRNTDDLYILDGGPCDIGVESTLLDMTCAPPRVLRPGAVTGTALKSILGDVTVVSTTVQDQSPGTIQRHYTTTLPAVMMSTESIIELLVQDTGTFAVLWVTDQPDHLPAHIAIRMPSDAEPYAAALYGALRRADASSADRILIEYPSGDNELWCSIRDRLCRATA